MSENIQDPNANVITDTTTPTNTNTTTTPPTTGAENKSLPIEDLLKTPEVRTLLEAARSQEKNKLYKTIESKETELKGLQEEVTRLKAEVSKKENDNLSEVELLQKQISELTATQAKLVADFQAEREAAVKKQREAELKAYREAKLRETGEELVLALVNGNSEQEIDASIELAKTEYQKIVAKALESSKKETPKPPVVNTPKVTNPAGAPAANLRPEEIKGMSREEWLKIRDKAIQMAKAGTL